MNLYDFAVDYLKKHTVGLTDSILDEYFKVDKASSLDEAFKRGVVSLSNDNGLRTAAIDKMLCGLSLKAVSEKYGGKIAELCTDLCSAADVRDSERSVKHEYYKFAGSIIKLAEYLSEFRDIDELYAVFEKADSLEEKVKLIKTVSKRVLIFVYPSKARFPKASNLIKNMGMTGYCNPDCYMCLSIYYIYGIILSGRNTIIPFVMAFEKVIEVAEECNVLPFVIDRALYLVRSGDFYRQGHENIKKSYDGSEEEFANLFKSQCE